MGKLLDQNEVAEWLGLSPGTLANWRSAKPPKGPVSRKLGRSVRYDADDVREWLEANRSDPEGGETAQAV